MGDTVIVETPVDEVVSIVTQGPQGPFGSEAATLTTTGDLLYRDALANDRLPIGSEGQVLKVSSGLPAWGNESGAVTSVNGETGAVTTATTAQGALADTAVQPGDLATVATSGDYDDLANKPASFTPSAHASSHHTGGSDELAAHQINGQTIFIAASSFLSADTTLSANRARQLTISNTNASGINVTLPTAAGGTLNGDTYVIIGGSTISGPITIRRINVLSPLIYETLATITATGQQFRFRATNAATGGWSLVPVDTHTHPASDITSGTLTHERGGLEADVSAYDGLVKISGGSTSAVTVTSAGEALLDDADAAAQRTTLGLGTAAVEDTTAFAAPADIPDPSSATPQALGTAAAGSSEDYSRADHAHSADISDSNFRVSDNGDATKKLAFECSGITTGQTRTLTAPDASGRIQVEGQAIGSTTPAAGTFTTLTANNGTLTASAPVLDLAQTWNASGVTFTGIKADFTNTASASGSLLMDLQVGGTSQFWVRRDGMAAATAMRHPTSSTTAVLIGGTGGFNSATLAVGSQVIRLTSITPITWGPGANHLDGADLVVLRDAAQTLAQRNGTNAQTFNIYNTYTDSTNYERGFLKWDSNVFQIGTEKGSSGGSARQVDLVGPNNSKITLVAQGNGKILFAGGTTSEQTVQIARQAMVLDEDTPLQWSGDGLRVDQGISTTGTALYKDASSTLGLRNGVNAQTFRIYNTSDDSNVDFERLNLRWASNEFILDAEAGGTGTLRGIKIGSATTSLLGFYGVTPVDQPATVTDPTGGGTIDTEARTAIEAIIDRLQELGLIA